MQLEDTTADSAAETVELTYREAIRAAMEDELAADETVLLMGEDVGAAGGVFKTSEGLLDRFGAERVRDTPICEEGFLGVALGMAVTGLRPIVEVMFSDFLPTAGDAIVNELPKYRFMSGGQCSVPVTVRSICGATGRFGTQHSATGESWYIGLPGLRVATAGTPASAYGVLRAAIRSDDPVLFFEHKGLYGRKGDVCRSPNAVAPLGKATLLRDGSDVTVVATLLMADRAVAAADRLRDASISAEVVELTWLRPLDVDTVAKSVAKTGQLLVVEEQVQAGGWGATVIAQLVQAGTPMRSVPASLSLPDDLLIPYSPSLEDAVVPSLDAIADRIRGLVASR
jgi:pyruvate dehydrogenase E1 component beta subunit